MVYDCRYTWLHGHHVLCQMCALRRPGQRYARHTQDAKSNFVRRIVEQKSKSLQKNRRSNPKNPVESEEITDVWQSQHQALEVQQALTLYHAFDKTADPFGPAVFLYRTSSAPSGAPQSGAAHCAVQAFWAAGTKPWRRGNSFAPSISIYSGVPGRQRRLGRIRNTA